MRLLRTNILNRGSVFASKKGDILYPKGIIWIDKEGEEHKTNFYEITVANLGTLKYSRIGSVYDILWYIHEEEFTLEFTDDFRRRIKHQIDTNTTSTDNEETHPEIAKFSPEWIDEQFCNPLRYTISEDLKSAIETLGNMKQRRNTNNAAQKLSQAKYRQKDDSKESAKKRRRFALDSNMEIRKSLKWLKENPDSKFEDYQRIVLSNED